jgi:branched-chain amino acid aminotransferase
MSEEQMLEAVNETIRVNYDEFDEDDEHRIMIDVTRGLLGIYQGVVGTHNGINIIIADFPLKWTVRGMGKLFDTGINAIIPSQRAIPASLIDPKAKNRSRIHYLMANMQISGYEGDNNWALLLDTDDHIAEGTGDNFFMVKEGIIYTPEPRNILRGISRQYVMELSKELGIPVKECNLDVYDLINADEAFLTGTPFCMLPVTSLNRQNIGNGKVGEVYTKIKNYWSEKVGVDIEEQIKMWDRHSSEASTGVTPYSFKK